MRFSSRSKGLLGFAIILCLAVLVQPATARQTPGHPLASQAKYVFFFIGDGMALSQRMAAAEFAGQPLTMDTFPAQGITTTQAQNRFITGSAAAATALSAGAKTNVNFIGIDPAFRPLKTIAERARDAGKKVGIISSVSIDHATPAAFYAHVKSRSMYHEIAHALATSGFHFFGGGGLVDPEGKRSEKPLGNALEAIKEAGYTVTRGKEDFLGLTRKDGKALAINGWLQDSQAMPHAIDMTEEDITLAEYTAKAVELLGGKEGFFLMVEGGKIDWACHANDGATAIRNTLALDEAVRVAVEFYYEHPNETLIVVTGDHECGGMSLGFSGTKYGTSFGLLRAQKVSFVKFDQDVFGPYKAKCGGQFSFTDLKKLVTENFGLVFPKKGAATAEDSPSPLTLKPFEVERIRSAFARSLIGEFKASANAEERRLYGPYTPLTITLTHILNQKAGIGWTSFSHTGVPVATSAMGVGSGRFQGAYDNTDIALKLMEAMGMAPEVQYLEAAVASR